MLITNKYNTDYPDIVRLTYRVIVSKEKYSLRITDIWKLLLLAFDLKEFELIDLRLINNGQFESYLIDQQIAWMNGENVNFTDIYNAILTVGDFTANEKLIFNSGNFEERLWAILLVIVDPGMNI